MAEDPARWADLPQGLTRLLFARLARLRRDAGEPSLRTISERTGKAISHTTVGKAVHGPSIPQWEVLEVIVHVLGGDTLEFKRLWIAARDAQAPLPSADPFAPRQVGTSNAASNSTRSTRRRKAKRYSGEITARHPHLLHLHSCGAVQRVGHLPLIGATPGLVPLTPGCQTYNSSGRPNSLGQARARRAVKIVDVQAWQLNRLRDTQVSAMSLVHHPRVRALADIAHARCTHILPSQR